MISRKGFELAVGTLVVMILGLFVVAGGMLLVWKLVGDSEQVAGELSATQQEELNRLLTSGQLVAAYPAHQEIQPGKDVIFGVAVENRLDDDAEFEVVIRVYDSQQDQMAWSLAYESTINVLRNQKEHVAVAMRVPKDAVKGEYTVIIEATYPDGATPITYDSKRFLTLNVL